MLITISDLLEVPLASAVTAANARGACWRYPPGDSHDPDQARLWSVTHPLLSNGRYAEVVQLIQDAASYLQPGLAKTRHRNTCRSTARCSWPAQWRRHATTTGPLPGLFWPRPRRAYGGWARTPTHLWTGRPAACAVCRRMRVSTHARVGFISYIPTAVPLKNICSSISYVLGCGTQRDLIAFDRGRHRRASHLGRRTRSKRISSATYVLILLSNDSHLPGFRQHVWSFGSRQLGPNATVSAAEG